MDKKEKSELLRRVMAEKAKRNPNEIDKYMGGKRPEAFTEKIDTNMKSKTAPYTQKIKKNLVNKSSDFKDVVPEGKIKGGLSEFSRKQAIQKLASAERDAGKRALREGAKKVKFKGEKGILGKGMRKVLGKVGSKLPILGSLVGPALTLALTGNPNEAMASAFDTDDLGAGSDERGDLGLSNADRLKADRRAIDSKKEFKDGGKKDKAEKIKEGYKKYNKMKKGK